MKTLSKIVLSAAAVVAVFDISFAQTYINQPNDTINLTGKFEDLETLSIQQLNTSAKSIILKWQKVSDSVPVAWEASVCDNVTCNTTLVDSGTMNPVNPGEYGLLLLHITPFANYGKAIVRYAVWDAASATKKDTLTYILTLTPTTAINQLEKDTVFSVFPNPTNANLNIFFADNKQYQFQIFNSIGETIYSGNAMSNCILPIANWKNGAYTISIFSVNKIINTKKFLILK